MNKLKGDCFNGHNTIIFIVQQLVNVIIFPLEAGNSSSTLQEGIFVYTLVKLYNKANFSIRLIQIFL